MTTPTKSHWRFALIPLLLLIGLGGFIAYQEYVLTTGDEAILATRPVDPRDLFRGEYVILRYDIETADLVSETISASSDVATLYVQLEKDTTGVDRVVAVAETPDTDGVWLQGEVSGRRLRFPDLEQYYVPEGSGTPIERLGSDVHVKVSVKGDQSRIVELLDADLAPIEPRDYLE